MKEFIKNTLGIELSDKQLQQFELFCDLLLEANQKFNLTAICDREQIFQKHFVDSMLGSALVAQNSTVCDVGSGAGFPALPLKIARPDLMITTVDSLNKRVNFLRETAQLLAVELNTVHSRTEDFSRTANRETFDVVTARAVAPLNILLEYCGAIAKVNGIVLAYKTDQSEVELCSHAAKELGLEFCKAQHFVLPSGDKRCLLAFKKIKPTPAKYPRGQNKPRTTPL